MTRRSLALAALALSLAVAAPASAQIQTRGPEVYPGRITIDAHLGFSAGVVGGTPGGFKVQAGFGFKLTELIWIDANLNVVIGGAGGGCAFGYGGCGVFGYGTALEPAAGIKLKFKITQFPLVPYVKVNAVFMGVVARYCGDNGFGFGGRAGGGLKYFLTKNIGLGVEFTTTFGPAWYNGFNSCVGGGFGSHGEFYWSFDGAIGGEFAF